MFNTYLNDFTDRWINKAENHKDETPSGAFDRFFSLFVPFNALYQAATERLLARGEIDKRDTYDRKAATENTAKYVDASLLQRHLQTHCEEELKVVVKLIEDKTFYISTHRPTGRPDHRADQEYINGIKSGEPEKFCRGILVLLYLTRCNMFHGSKDFKHIQIQILNPMNKILYQVIQILLKRLHQDS